MHMAYVTYLLAMVEVMITCDHYLFFYCPANVVYNNNINDNHIKTPHIEYLNGLDTLLRPFFFTIILLVPIAITNKEIEN